MASIRPCVAVTTYEMACNPTFNLTLSQKVYWRTMILDEGHKVKNEETAAHAVLKKVHRQHTLLLTGRGLHSSTSRLNVNAFCGMGGCV